MQTQTASGDTATCKRRGRPRLRAEAVSTLFWIRLSPQERELLQRAAAHNRQNLSAFAREVLLDGISQTIEIHSSTDNS